MSDLLFEKVCCSQLNWQETNFANRDLIPTSRVLLGRFPTPLHKFAVPSGCANVQFWIKRDDLSSFDLSGNKVRKLEYLLAEAIRLNCDCVLTAGGIQSNHARSTAVAARQLGLEPHLIIRTPSGLASELSTDLTGNLLLNQMVGSQMYSVSVAHYIQHGSDALLTQLAQYLTSQGKRPYIIPMGGSNALGSFGYMAAMDELAQQLTRLELPNFDHIVLACGSGGTLAGVTLAAKLSGLSSTKIHAVGVCDSPEYFYEHIQHIATELGVDMTVHGEPHSWCSIYDGKGGGYGRNSSDELLFIREVAGATGVVLDSVYAGKALYHFVRHVLEEQGAAEVAGVRAGQRVLFLHTGGTLGLYDKQQQIAGILHSSTESGHGPIVHNLIDIL